MNCYHHHYLSLFAALMLVISAGPIACSSSSSAEQEDEVEAAAPEGPTADELFAQATDALDDHQWEQAIELYTEVTDLDPDRWDAHMNRAIALMKNEQFDESLQAFEDSFNAGGDTEPVVYTNLGNLYQERGLHEAAIDAYRSSMAHRGELHYDTLLNIGASFTFLNAHEEAIQTARRAIELNPDDPRAHSTLGLNIYSSGQPDQALEIYDELVAMAPDYAPAQYNRGFVLLRIGEDNAAREAFTNYLKLAPEGPYADKAEDHITTLDRRADRE